MNLLENLFFKEFLRFFSYNHVRKKFLIEKGVQSVKRKQIAAIITAMTIVLGITAYGSENVSADKENKERTEIESTLNISNNDEITWNYDSQSDSWTMSGVYQ